VAYRRSFRRVSVQAAISMSSLQSRDADAVLFAYLTAEVLIG
jgi:hypothetical protein